MAGACPMELGKMQFLEEPTLDNRPGGGDPDRSIIVPRDGTSVTRQRAGTDVLLTPAFVRGVIMVSGVTPTVRAILRL